MAQKTIKVRILHGLGEWKRGEIVRIPAGTALTYSQPRGDKPANVELLEKVRTKQTKQAEPAEEPNEEPAAEAKE
jgi:hypothetical protein